MNTLHTNNSDYKVIVGISGGVDSAVSAYLLKQQGYQVEGLFMKNWDEDDSPEYCSAEVDLVDAEQVCEVLDIPLGVVNFSFEYWDRVFEYFLEEYRAGRTPNPDIMCNKEIKFRAFLDFAMTKGADYIATGHYVRSNRSNGMVQLLKGEDNNKDQSYFLYALNQEQVSKAIFPLGQIEKNEVRQIAAELGFANADKKDSTGICFIGERKFTDFLNRYLPANPGDIVSDNGTLLGRHNGLMFHTIGQRKGLNIGGRADASEAPWYVYDKDLSTNQLKVCQGVNNELMYTNTLVASQLNWIKGSAPAEQFSACCKVRYRQPDQDCTIVLEGDKAVVHFNEPQRAITRGQSVVFYQGDICLGGGIIDDSWNEQ